MNIELVETDRLNRPAKLADYMKLADEMAYAFHDYMSDPDSYLRALYFECRQKLELALITREVPK
jgi:hypothetical protein